MSKCLNVSMLERHNLKQLKQQEDTTSLKKRHQKERREAHLETKRSFQRLGTHISARTDGSEWSESVVWRVARSSPDAYSGLQWSTVVYMLSFQADHGREIVAQAQWCLLLVIRGYQNGGRHGVTKHVLKQH